MMQVDLARIGAAEAVAEIRAGNLTSEALVCAGMDRIVALDPRIRAFTDILQSELALTPT